MYYNSIKPNVEFNTKKRIETEKDSDKDGKAWYELINNAMYHKAMESEPIYVKKIIW